MKNKTVKNNKRKFVFNKKLLIGALVAVFTTSVLMVSGVLPALYKSSVLNVPNHKAFDGTTYPVKKVPDWVHLSSGEWDMEYNEFKSNQLINIPSYSTKVLLKGTDNDARNAQTTYSVVYMGNYEFDHKENAGSHLAVDIKIPKGTPIYAIANGTVIKVSTQSDGFGNHIVLQHNNFPTLDDKNDKETLYSSYSHLSKVSVDDREVVKKGDLIGYSGETGTATTPHLHFQIDNDKAPWHPYWPFTWQDVRDAGLDFFSAINAGLGKSAALETTINPMKYVQKYIGKDALYTSDGDDDEDDNTSNKAKSYIDETADEEEEEEEDSEPVKKTVKKATVVEEDENLPAVSFEIEVAQSYLINKSDEFVIQVLDEDGNKLTDRFRESLTLSSDNGLFELNKSSASFGSDGFYFGEITGVADGKDRLVLTYGNDEYKSDSFKVVTSDPKLGFTDVSKDNEYRKSIMYLASKGVVQGYSDGTFKPTKNVSRAEALKLVLEGNKTSLSSGKVKFSDIDADSWYATYVYTANKKNIVSGYNDGTFKPQNTVNKAEFLKILFTAMKVKVDSSVDESPYNDVGKNTWFAPYFAKAKELEILDNSENIDPSAPMTRQEIADAIYRVMKL